MNIITSKVNRKILAASLLGIGLAGIPAQGMLASETLMKSVQVQQQQQSIHISGVVSDSEGPIIGASIVEKGVKGNGTVSDMDGKFNMSVKPGATLIVSYMGYKKVEVKAVAGKEIQVNMQQDSELLNEVVVVGFGTQKKVNLTGAVDVIDSKQMAERPVSNAVQALQGAAPGLQITQSSGSIDSRPSINVRGGTTIGQGSSGDPLVLIDGMEGDLNSINPQDIESVSVLKDAAASSIYGSRAPFGVILVTTKRGKEGKATINYNNSFRIGTPNIKNHLMNSVDFASWMNDAITNAGKSAYFDTKEDGTGRFDQIVAFHNAKYVSPGVRQKEDGTYIYEVRGYNNDTDKTWWGGYSNGIADTDWYDILYKDNNFSQQHNLSASGGTEKFRYYLSGSYFDQNGLLKVADDNLQRYTGTAKIESQLTNWLRLHYTMRFTREETQQPQKGGWYESVALRGWPVLPAYDWNGNHFYSDTSCMWAWADGGENHNQSDKIYHQLGFEIEPIKNWKTSADFNYRIQNSRGHNWTLPLMAYGKDGAPYYKDANTSVAESNYRENYLNFSARTEYDLTLAQAHHFHALAGMQIENLKQDYFSASRVGMMDLTKPELNLTNGLKDGVATTPGVSGYRNEWAVVGFFGRLNYDYKSRYLFEANLRSDGSSRFRKGNRWKTFPSFSLGWNIAEEKFMEPSRNWLDMLKLRFSYGSLGNQNVTDWYQTYLTISPSAQGAPWLQNGNKVATVGSPGIVSEALTWERVETYNIGVDWAMLHNRLTGSFNWYTRSTHDMVGNGKTLPAILGTGVPKTNNTDLQARGWELTLGWQDRLANGLSYGAKFSLYDSRTKITKYKDNPTNSIGGYMEGRYTGEIWGFETKGIAKTDKEMQDHLASLPNGGQDAIGSSWTAGDMMYKDINGDGKVSWGSSTLADPGDRKVIGNTTPRYQFGLDMNASWKGFDFRMFFQGVMKRDYWQGSAFMFGWTGDQWNCAGLTQVQDYFRDENTWSVKQGTTDVNLDAYLPRPVNGSKNIQCQTKYLQDASYIRLKNITLGYTIPTVITGKWGISNLRVYFSGENLWTGTSLNKQFDPETLSSSSGAAYPLSRTYSFGLSITF